MEQVLEAAFDAGARRAFYTVLRLSWEVSPLFREWLVAHYPDRATLVMERVCDMRGGRDHAAGFGQRMHGSGPWAQLDRAALRQGLCPAVAEPAARVARLKPVQAADATRTTGAVPRLCHALRSSNFWHFLQRASAGIAREAIESGVTRALFRCAGRPRSCRAGRRTPGSAPPAGPARCESSCRATDGCRPGPSGKRWSRRSGARSAATTR